LKNGADIIETSSYQINQSNLMKYLGINADEAKKILKRSVEIAVQARNETNFSIPNLLFL
jgi:S-methylmethionine-dependent homocysteine/selenocysteine methylase